MEAATTVTSRLAYRQCAKCFNRIVLPAFSESHCLKCGKFIICSNTPADSLCPECAIKLNRCIHCGVELDKED